MVKDGVSKVLAKRNAFYNSGLWHKLNIEVINNQIHVSFHDKLLFKTSNNDFYNGYIGICTNSKTGILIDNVHVQSINSFQNENGTLLRKNQNKFYYTFSDRSDVAMDLCDWIPSDNMKYDKYFGFNELLSKDLYEEYLLVHRKKFIGPTSLSFDYQYCKYEFESSDLPEGINPFLLFQIFADSIMHEYTFSVTNDYAYVYLDRSLIKQVELPHENRSYWLDMTYKNNILTFTSGQNCSIQINVASEFTYYNLGFGYDGYGILKNIYPQIVIQQE